MKPYVICHMLSSVDGRILPDRWHPPLQDHSFYERLHEEIGCDAWLVGRVTGQEFASRDTPIHRPGISHLSDRAGSRGRTPMRGRSCLMPREKSHGAAATWAAIHCHRAHPGCFG
jgi:hypothetical protein